MPGIGQVSDKVSKVPYQLFNILWSNTHSVIFGAFKDGEV
jgi:hypothetical protein